MPSTPCTCTSMKPGTMMWPRDVVPVARRHAIDGLGRDVGDQAVVVDHERAAIEQSSPAARARAPERIVVMARSIQEGSATSFRPSSGSGSWPAREKDRAIELGERAA